MSTLSAKVPVTRRVARTHQGQLVDFRERKISGDPTRAARVAALKEAVQSGRYRPDPENLARILIPVLGL